jgi:dihydroorotate dehydrogenase electron transfer subunit
MQCPAKIVSNDILQGDYRRVRFAVPEAAAATMPGQFAHLKIARLRDRVLRRPFSICDVDADGLMTIVYKVVGEGTEVLSTLEPGVECDMIAPLGNGFPIPAPGDFPVIVAGGYGAAATLLLAKRSPTPGVVLIGARSKPDLILTAEFAATGFKVMTATEDGSAGATGRVTALIAPAAADAGGRRPRIYACGPHGMLMAVGKMADGLGVEADLSLDHLMCCGVGACFACVVKVKADNPDGWRYARTCKEGPVFKSTAVWHGE